MYGINAAASVYKPVVGDQTIAAPTGGENVKVLPTGKFTSVTDVFSTEEETVDVAIGVSGVTLL